MATHLYFLRRPVSREPPPQQLEDAFVNQNQDKSRNHSEWHPLNTKIKAQKDKA